MENSHSEKGESFRDEFMKKKLIITVGVSGSGKTSWAEQHVANNTDSENQWLIIARDEARRELFPEFEAHEYKHTKAREKKVSAHCEAQFIMGVGMGLNIIIADTNLNSKYRELWKTRGEENGYEVEFKDFPMTFDEILQRNQHRGVTSAKMDILHKQWKMWMEYVGRPKYVPDESKRKAIIVDVDGTIAIKGDRSPYDWKRVGEDKPRKMIIQMIQQFATLHRAVIIFLSGRDGVCYQETRDWLCEHTYFTGALGDMLIMRDQDDTRKDSVIKEELFWEYISNEYNVLAVFDDRCQVVEMWYDLGIENVICVGDQRNRF